jgi:hypothetical protein
MTTVVASSVKQFVPDNGNRGDGQPRPPVRDQPLTDTGLADNLHQAPGSRDEQDQDDYEPQYDAILASHIIGVQSLK